MRDPDLMMKLLEEMGERPDGSILAVRLLDMRGSELKQAYHVELLCDAGLAQQKSDSSFRITNIGYDFLGAINRDRTITFAKFKKLVQEGIELTEAARRMTDLVNVAS